MKVLFAFLALVGSAYADCACTKDKCACEKKVCDGQSCRIVHDCQCGPADNCKTVCPKCATIDPKMVNEEPNTQVWQYYQSSVRLTELGGSGTIVDCYENDKGKFVCLVLSCWHVVDKNPESVKIDIFWPQKETVTGYILGSDKLDDLSLLVFQSDHPFTFIPLAPEDTIQKGDRITSIGCPNRVDPVGYFANITETNGKSDIAFSKGSPRYYYDHPSTGGHSGGGGFKNGKTIGVLVATFGSYSEMVPTAVCRHFYDFTLKNKVPTCLFRWLFNRRNGGSQPGYQGPPASVQPDISLTPKPTVPDVPVQEPVPEVPNNPFKLPVLFGAISGAITAFFEFRKRAA